MMGHPPWWVCLHPGVARSTLAEKALPVQLTTEQAVELSYAAELAEVASALQRGVPVLVECEKDLTPFFYRNLRTRFRQAGLASVYIDGRVPQESLADRMTVRLMEVMIVQLREAVRI